MGQCLGGGNSGDQSPELKNARMMDQKLSKQAKDGQFNRERRVLLLGTGESGKSTFLKQMKLLYGNGLELDQYKNSVKENIILGMHDLLTAHAKLVDEKQCDDLPEQSMQAKRTFSELYESHKQKMEMNAETIGTLELLWNDPQIRQTWDHRIRFQIQESVGHFFDNLQRFLATDFAVTEDDALRLRIRTTGLTKEVFNINGEHLVMLDVGGQKNERRKWISQFEGVNAILFLCAISEYDQMLFEDETMNRMHDSIDVFRSLLREPYFDDTLFLLFLNKKDMFLKKFEHTNLRICFPDYPEDKDQDVEFAIQFVSEKYLDQRVNGKHRDIAIHVTCATDRDNMKIVLTKVQESIVSNGLREVGL